MKGTAKLGLSGADKGQIKVGMNNWTLLQVPEQRGTGGGQQGGHGEQWQLQLEAGP